MPTQNQPATAALAALILLQTTMLGALYAGVAPHPPATIAPFAMAPFLGASLSAAAAALILGPLATTAGKACTILAILMALVSFGPQKLLDPAFPQIWPAVVTAWIAIISLIKPLLHAIRRRQPQAHA